PPPQVSIESLQLLGRRIRAGRLERRPSDRAVPEFGTGLSFRLLRAGDLRLHDGADRRRFRKGPCRIEQESADRDQSEKPTEGDAARLRQLPFASERGVPEFRVDLLEPPGLHGFKPDPRALQLDQEEFDAHVDRDELGQERVSRVVGADVPLGCRQHHEAIVLEERPGLRVQLHFGKTFDLRQIVRRGAGAAQQQDHRPPSRAAHLASLNVRDDERVQDPLEDRAIHRIIAGMLILLLSAVLAQEGSTANWPSFRGTDASGTATATLPLTWNGDAAVGPAKNLRWKTPIPGLSHSSPIVWGDRLFVATAVRVDGA